MQIAIRPERAGEYAAIEEVNRLAFGGENEARLVNAIRQAPGFDPALSLVAVHADTVVGHILFSPIHVDSDQARIPGLALAPMAVLPSFQRQGIGTELVHEGVKACRQLGHALLVVVGHPHFYPRFGFVPGASYGIRVPFDVPAEAFMVLLLGRSAGPPAIGGVVQYPAVFNEV